VKRIIFLIILAFSQIAFAQPPANADIMPNVQGLKIAFLTQKVALSSEEAQKFWPAYFSYMDDLKAIRKQKKENILQYEEKALQIKKKHSAEFKKILGSDERANKVFLAEMEFGNEIRKALINRHRFREKVDKANGGAGNTPPADN
jgi:hypothetical protein